MPDGKGDAIGESAVHMDHPVTMLQLKPRVERRGSRLVITTRRADTSSKACRRFLMKSWVIGLG
jgi:hypothetical protein